LARARVLVTGIVQGVNFRHHTRIQALRRGLAGFVRNRPDGSVEAVFQGDRTSIAEVIDWCHKGPPSARVRNVSVIWEDGEEDFEGFHILR